MLYPPAEPLESVFSPPQGVPMGPLGQPPKLRVFEADPKYNHMVVLFGERGYSREEGSRHMGVGPPMAPPNLRGSFWLVLLVNLLLFWD